MKLKRYCHGCWFALVVPMLFLAACGDQAGSKVAAAPALEVLVTEVERRDVPLSMDMVGTTHGTQDVPIRARVEGFLESVDFQEGTFVDKGDLLYTIDAQPFQAKLVEAQSQLAAAQTMLAKSESDLARIKPLAISLRLFSCAIAWCAQVAAAPEHNRISVLISGKCQGSNVSIPAGGQIP